jgi:glutaconate CoA-transferase subunit A
MRDKTMSLAEAATLVKDGDVVGLQNMATQAAPMAMVRELIRQQRRDLTLVALVGGIAVDWLAAAGCLKKFLGPVVSMERFGLCQNYRKAVQAGLIEVEEYSETTFLARLGAAARGMPFGISKGLIGTDLVGLHPDTLREMEDPFGTETLVLACAPLGLDVALVHAHRSDAAGNAQYDPHTIWPDVQIFPKAAQRVIVTTEKLVSDEEIRRRAGSTAIPHFIVDAVVEVPYGAHPTSWFPEYGYDSGMHESYTRASADPKATQAWLDKYVRRPATQEAYLEAAGADLEALRRWE